MRLGLQSFLHFPTLNLMNACLHIVELLSHVCSLLCDDEQLAALASLARTCKAFNGQ
jgi:hypothetical protein